MPCAPSRSARCPCCGWLGTLQIWHLVIVALIMGIATVFFDVSYQSIIPSLVRPGQIAEANGKLESTQQIAGLTGPGDRRLADRRRSPRPSRSSRRSARTWSRSSRCCSRATTRSARARRPPADPHRDRRGPALGVRQPLPAPHRRHHGLREPVRHDLDDPAADLPAARARAHPRADGRDLLARRGRRTRRRDRDAAHRRTHRRGPHAAAQRDRVQPGPAAAADGVAVPADRVPLPRRADAS